MLLIAYNYQIFFAKSIAGLIYIVYNNNVAKVIIGI